jgi:hypothetical protein
MSSKRIVVATRSDDQIGTAAEVANFALEHGAKTVSSYGVGGFGKYTSVDILEIKEEDEARILKKYKDYFNAHNIEVRLLNGSATFYEYVVEIPDPNSRKELVLDRIGKLLGSLLSHGCYTLEPAAESAFKETQFAIAVDGFSAADDLEFRLLLMGDMAVNLISAREVSIVESGRRLLTYAQHSF